MSFLRFTDTQLALLQSLIAMVSALILSQNPLLSTMLSLSNEFSVWLAGSFVADTIITICMTYILSQARHATAWGPTESMLTRLINRVIQSGAATVIVAAINLAIFIKLPETNYYYVPAYILGKIYTNSLMLNLNLRRPNGTYVTGHGNDVLHLSPLPTLREEVHIRVEQHTALNDTKWTASVADPSN
ncbi:hypothetical protein MSAN_00519100 [Mycena sanguinolenta]|uniref:DUF6534 domain-containing protein n=1 Tax=Mycena sanguinolenta TaxID=230812 RepID=A0A8H6Z5T9_9AGAR|nr:hypothetical protein MSAN_00519100 [Mycena sanguinolenta]